MSIWFTSDTHFGQERTLELSRRPFDSVNQMDRALVARWNEVVKPEDTVFHLGDFGDPSKVRQLNGERVVLVPGNYDTPVVIESLRKYCSKLFVWDEPCALFAPPDGFDLPYELHLVHEPEKATSTSFFYLFGHIHQLQMVKRNGLNVGVDCHQFRPIGLETIKFYYDAITKHYDHNVFMERLGDPICAGCASWEGRSYPEEGGGCGTFDHPDETGNCPHFRPYRMRDF